MATFVHLTSEKNLSGIQRAGIKPEPIHYPEAPTGVFCMPVAANFFATLTGGAIPLALII